LPIPPLSKWSHQTSCQAVEEEPEKPFLAISAEMGSHAFQYFPDRELRRGDDENRFSWQTPDARTTLATRMIATTNY
jgi:hypothetical protein